MNGATATLNRRVVLGEKTAQKLRDMVAQIAATESYLPQQQFESAMQWHMGNFDMERLTFG